MQKITLMSCHHWGKLLWKSGDQIKNKRNRLDNIDNLTTMLCKHLQHKAINNHKHKVHMFIECRSCVPRLIAEFSPPPPFSLFLSQFFSHTIYINWNIIYTICFTYKIFVRYFLCITPRTGFLVAPFSHWADRERAPLRFVRYCGRPIYRNFAADSSNSGCFVTVCVCLLETSIAFLRDKLCVGYFSYRAVDIDI
jgi:hypothetical protein